MIFHMCISGKKVNFLCQTNNSVCVHKDDMTMAGLKMSYNSIIKYQQQAYELGKNI